MWAVPVFAILPLAAGVAAYREPLASRVWIHPLAVMSPGLVAVFLGFLTCRGFECGGVVGLLAMAVLATLILLVLAFVVFWLRRRSTKTTGT